MEPATDEETWRARRIAIAEELAALGKDAVPHLIDVVTKPGIHDGFFVARRALVKIGADAVPALIELVGSEEPLIRERTIELLGAIGPKARDAVPSLTSLLRHEHACTRYWAARALGHIGTAASNAIPELRAMLADDREYEYRNAVRRAAATAIRRIGAPATRPSQQSG